MCNAAYPRKSAVKRKFCSVACDENAAALVCEQCGKHIKPLRRVCHNCADAAQINAPHASLAEIAVMGSCPHPAGSPGKVAALRYRVAHGLPLYHAGDNPLRIDHRDYEACGSKLPDQVADRIQALLAEGLTWASIAERLMVSQSYINNVMKRHRESLASEATKAAAAEVAESPVA